MNLVIDEIRSFDMNPHIIPSLHHASELYAADPQA